MINKIISSTKKNKVCYTFNSAADLIIRYIKLYYSSSFTESSSTSLF